MPGEDQGRLRQAGGLAEPGQGLQGLAWTRIVASFPAVNVQPEGGDLSDIVLAPPLSRGAGLLVGGAGVVGV